MEDSKAKTKHSETYYRRQRFYPTPQNKLKLHKAAFNDDGSKKDNISMNKIINLALDNYFKSEGTPAA